MTGERSNQKLRTRTALVRAAAELVREGAEPSVPLAAERALVSVATAYRYFSSADDLWWEATELALQHDSAFDDALIVVDTAGPDPHARLEAFTRALGFHMLDDQMSYRRFLKSAIEKSLDTRHSDDDGLVRQGRSATAIDVILAPLRETMAPADLDRIAHALGTVIGVEVVIALLDDLGLSVDVAKHTLLDVNRWLLAGALAELRPNASEAARAKPANRRR